jgi:hypothetical protein
MLILKTNNKTYEITKYLNGRTYIQIYIGYTLKTAKEMFKTDYELQKNKEATRWEKFIEN